MLIIVDKRQTIRAQSYETFRRQIERLKFYKIGPIHLTFSSRRETSKSLDSSSSVRARFFPFPSAADLSFSDLSFVDDLSLFKSFVNALISRLIL